MQADIVGKIISSFTWESSTQESYDAYELEHRSHVVVCLGIVLQKKILAEPTYMVRQY